jgi:nicotinamidase-related amidase
MFVFGAKDAVIVIDMLNDFVREGAPLEVPAARQIIPALRETLAKARAAGVPVVYVCDSHAPNDPEFDIWPPHAVTATKGAAIVDELTPEPTDRIVLKHRVLGFFRDGLAQVLESLGIERVILTGILTDICVFFGAAGAYELGYKCVALSDCVAALTEDDHQWALRQMKRILAVELAEGAGD